jgi:hypothetical protein
MAATAATSAAIGLPAHREADGLGTAALDDRSGPEGLLIVAELPVTATRDGRDACRFGVPAQIALELQPEDGARFCCSSAGADGGCEGGPSSGCAYLVREEIVPGGTGDAPPPASVALKMATCPPRGRYRVDVWIDSVHHRGPHPFVSQDCPAEASIRPPTIAVLGNCPGLTTQDESLAEERHAICEEKLARGDPHASECNAMWIQRRFSVEGSR